MKPTNLLERLLTFSEPKRRTRRAANGLLRRFGTLVDVLTASPSDLSAVKIIGTNSVSLIALLHVIGEECLKERMRKQDLNQALEPAVQFSSLKLVGLPHEALLAVFLDVRGRVIYEEVMNEGGVDRISVGPRRLFETALRHGATGLILCHNHPSGHTAPSDEDKRFTRLVKKAAGFLDIHLADHIIVGRRGYFSFQENGLL